MASHFWFAVLCWKEPCTDFWHFLVTFWESDCFWSQGCWRWGWCDLITKNWKQELGLTQLGCRNWVGLLCFWAPTIWTLSVKPVKACREMGLQIHAPCNSDIWRPWGKLRGWSVGSDGMPWLYLLIVKQLLIAVEATALSRGTPFLPMTHPPLTTPHPGSTCSSFVPPGGPLSPAPLTAWVRSSGLGPSGKGQPPAAMVGQTWPAFWCLKASDSLLAWASGGCGIFSVPLGKASVVL